MASDDNKTQALDLFEGRQYQITQGERKICVGVALTLLGNYLFNRGDDESFDPCAVSRCLEEHVRDVFWKIIMEDLKNGPKSVPSKIDSVEDYLRREIYSKKDLPVAVENIGKQEWEKGSNDNNWKFVTVKDYFCAGTDGYFQREHVDGEIIGCLNKLLNGILEAILLGNNEKSTFYAVRETFFNCDGKEPKFGFIRACKHSEKAAGACHEHDCNRCRESIYKLDFVDEPESARNSIETNSLNLIKSYLENYRVPVLMMVPLKWLTGGGPFSPVEIITRANKNEEEPEPDHAILVTGYTSSDEHGNFNLISYETSGNYDIIRKNNDLESNSLINGRMRITHQPVLLPMQMTWGTKKQFYDIFIAYRHSTSKEIADYVYEQLTNEGLSVYMADHEDNGLSVDIDSQCLRVVRSTKIFLLILSEGSLDGIEPEMTLYKEIEYAYGKDESKNPTADGNVFMIFNDVNMDENNAKEAWRKIVSKLILIRSKIKPTSEKYNSLYNSVKAPWLHKFNKIVRSQGLKGKIYTTYNEMLNYKYDRILSDIFDYCMKDLHGCFDSREVEIKNRKLTCVCIKSWILTCKNDGYSSDFYGWAGKRILILEVFLRYNGKKEREIWEEFNEYFDQMFYPLQCTKNNIMGCCALIVSDEHFYNSTLLKNGCRIQVICKEGYDYNGGDFIKHEISQKEQEEQAIFPIMTPFLKHFIDRLQNQIADEKEVHNG